MKTLICTRTGQSITLLHQLASSGEGEIWRTNRSGYLAKVYYSPHSERIRKLEVMIAHPPQDPNAHINHISFAWPTALLQDSVGTPVGFLMPEVAQAVDLLEVYNPLRRQAMLPTFNWLYLHATAMNIASLVWAIHSVGYVLGDLKPQNILVNNGALPSIIDTDSFQVRHPKTGELYRCPVGSEGFTPAELMDQDLATVEQTDVQDRFRLGVILYLLLFGDHPFKGRWTGTGDSPDPNELLRQGWWPHGSGSPIQPSFLTVPLKTVHPVLQQCFLRCFNEGHLNPLLRPTAAEWVQSFKVAIADLKRCRTVKNHYFSKSDGHCHWCKRKQQLGIDIFAAPPKPVKTRWDKVLQRSKTQVARIAQLSPKMLPRAIALRDPALKILGRLQGVVGQGKPLSALMSQVPSGVFGVSTGQKSMKATQRLRASWMSMVGGIAAIAMLFAVFVGFSQPRLDAEEMGLTLVGIGLCLGLAVFGLILQSATSKLKN
jgi:DNA-binding helix-hairpin-helix protein with protein kinase domain